MKDFADLKKILIYRIGHLGDTIVALPAFWEIREKFPKAELTLLTNSDAKNKNYLTAKNILPSVGLFDNYLQYDNSAEKLSKAITYTNLFLQIKKNKYDCLFYLSTRNRTDYQIERDVKFFKFAGINKIYGAEYLKKNQLNFNQLKPLPVVEPEYRFLLNSLEFDKSNNFSNLKHDVGLTDAEKIQAENWLESNCGSDYREKKLVAVATGSNWNSKIWSEKKYIEVLTLLIKDFDIYPIIFGGKEDFELGHRILSNISDGANACGKLNIRESFAALEKCLFYLGNDTGTMHMAAAVGIPCVAVFAATDFKGRWYPFGANNKIFRYTVECEGCHTPNCFNNHKCLEMITPVNVYEACCEILLK